MADLRSDALQVVLYDEGTPPAQVGVLSNPLFAVASSSPPSSTGGRSAIHVSLSGQTADASAYTVSADKTLFVTNLVFSALQTSTTTYGEIAIQDGETGTLKVPLLYGRAGSAPTNPTGLIGTVPLSFVEPIQFNSGKSVFVKIVSGTIRWALLLTGYEE